MKKFLTKMWLKLKAWEQQTDAEFAGMDEIQRNAVIEFINDSTY
jgi:hypothetical protein